uniref:Ladinin 1 n=1 Tax=Taeniopygia guttata TaxID=59729 RepID=H0YSV7_TAEGU
GRAAERAPAKAPEPAVIHIHGGGSCQPCQGHQPSLQQTFIPGEAAVSRGRGGAEALRGAEDTRREKDKVPPTCVRKAEAREGAEGARGGRKLLGDRAPAPWEAGEQPGCRAGSGGGQRQRGPARRQEPGASLREEGGAEGTAPGQRPRSADSSGEQRKEAKEPPEVGSCRLREVKILTRVGNRSTEEKTSVVTSSLEQQPSRNPSKQVIQLSPPRDEPAEKPDPSPTHVTFSSSIRRASPRTVSFRIISKKQKEESQSPLTRSASLRIPGSNSTIGEKLEKYNSAVQRSEGVKCSVPAQKSRLLSSEGVASKRDFFERSAPGKAEPAALRKDSLKIPGSVTSRINLWISRAQEPAKEENSKNQQPGKARCLDKAAWRHLWRHQVAVIPAVVSDHLGKPGLLQRPKPSPTQPSSSHCHESPVPCVGAAQVMGSSACRMGRKKPGRVSLCP